MSKKTKLKFILAGNIPEVEEKETSEVVELNESTSTKEECCEEPVEECSEVEPEVVPEVDSDKDSSLIDYTPYNVPVGKTKDNGILLCIILCVIILILGFLLYQKQQHNAPLPDNNDNEVVEPEYQELTTVIKGYVSSITDSKKEEFCQKLRQHYIDWSKMPVTDINEFLEENLEETRNILGFYRNKAISNEWEWHKLFCKGGVIDKWLEKSNVIITPTNKKAIFLAIAEGLK